MTNFFLILTSAGAAFLFDLVCIPALLHLSHRFKWYDSINHRKIHTGNIPRIGGVGIFISFFAGSAVYLFMRGIFNGPTIFQGWHHYLAAGVALVLIHGVGLLDDFANLRPRYKLYIQILAAVIVISTGSIFRTISFAFFDFELHLGIFGYPLTLIWIVGMSNAVNLLDGLDGLAGGVSGIAALFFGILFLASGNYTAAVLAFALFGSLLGYLVFNLPPARIFMGDSGSLFLGLFLAIIPVCGSGGSTRVLPLLPTITILLIPIFDTFAAIVRRVRRRQPIHHADREHIHHKLLTLGLSNWQILGIVYVIGILLGGSVYLKTVFAPEKAFFFMAGAWVIMLTVFILISRLNRKS